MKKNRQDQWIENLSAYLDGEVTIQERRKLEVLLQENESLRQQLSALAKTRALLRHAPRLKAPRNFTLTAAMLPQKQGSAFWLPMMSTSSILAAVALIVTYVFNLTSFASPKMMPNYAMDTAPMAESMTTAAEVAPLEDASQKSTEPTEAPLIIQWFGNLATGKGGGGPETAILAQEAPAPASEQLAIAGEAPATAAEEPARAMDEVLLDAAAPQVLPEEGAASDMQIFAAEAPTDITAEQPAAPLSEGIPLPTASAMSNEQPALLQAEATSDVLTFPAPMATTIPESRQLETAPLLQNPILGIAPAEEQGRIIQDTAENIPAPAFPIDSESQKTSIGILVLRASLLLVSLFTGIIAILLRYRQGR